MSAVNAELSIDDLVRNFQEPVYHLALSILDDPAEADEATQETFVAAMRALPAFRGQAAPATWLYAIAVNTCRSRWRKRLAWKRLAEAVAGALRLRGESAPSPEAASAERERAARIWRAVQALGEKHRLPVILRYYHDLPTAEIAAVLGISEGTVHSRLSVARDRLRAALRDERAGLAGPEAL